MSTILEKCYERQAITISFQLNSHTKDILRINRRDKPPHRLLRTRITQEGSNAKYIIIAALFASRVRLYIQKYNGVQL